MPEVNRICKNCGTVYTGNFCSSCGQKSFEKKDLSFKSFLEEMADEIFDYDSKILTTLKLLVLKPGRLTADFLNGKQKRYIAPLKLYLVIITVNFLVYSNLDNYSLVNVEYLLTVSPDSDLSAFVRKGLEGKSIHELNQQINNTLSISLYLVIFIYALFLKIIFRKREMFYVEHLIFCLHLMSFGFLRDTLLFPLNVINRDIGSVIAISTTLLYMYFAIPIVYQITGVKRFFAAIGMYGAFFLMFSASIVVSVLINLIF